MEWRGRCVDRIRQANMRKVGRKKIGNWGGDKKMGEREWVGGRSGESGR